MKVRAHLFISGIVQGVFFRETTKERALEVGVAGWVRNLKDGRVEAVFEGEKEKVDKMIEYCSKGSILAKVESVEVKWEEPEGLKDFKIIYSSF
ncbi:MAG TPA: acylphosphatase [Archaeoglobaceae archaeon]|nr:acylphosphatase [Archaeoglobaceae archaeon]